MPNVEPVKIELPEPVGRPVCRYCGADCSEGRSWDGGDLFVCGPCAITRRRYGDDSPRGFRAVKIDRPDRDGMTTFKIVYVLPENAGTKHYGFVIVAAEHEREFVELFNRVR